MKKWILKLLLALGASLIALLLAEATSRLIQPISPGAQKVSLEGVPVSEWLLPGSVYRQVSTEFDALTTITDKGHRVPATAGGPEVVFIGDSFTFGIGLSNRETFPYLYCHALAIVCANLGKPGASTVEELDFLQRSLDRWGERPQRVKLFMFAMSSSFLAGNDLADNLEDVAHGGDLEDIVLGESSDYAAEANEPIGHDAGKPGTASEALETLLGYRKEVLRYSNMIRMFKFYLGPWVKGMLAPGVASRRLEEALTATGLQLTRLQALARRYGFAYEIYLIHPVQDIVRGTHEETLARLSEISPAPIKGTAALFSDDPSSYYFLYDGHLNAKGSRKLADFLIADDR